MVPTVGGPTFNWPMAITAGDISRYGRRILVRNYPGEYRKVGKNSNFNSKFQV